MYGDIIPLLGEKSRAWLSSVQHLSPSEVQNHAVSAAQTGLMPFADALAIKAAADRVSQSKPAPAPGNVMNELQGKIQSALSGQPVAPQMPPQMPAAPQPQVDPRMMAGLGTLPAPNMQGAQGMAGGGIVSFADGGLSYTDPSRWLNTPLIYRTPATAQPRTEDEEEPQRPQYDFNTRLEELYGSLGALTPVDEAKIEQDAGTEFDKFGLDKPIEERLAQLTERGKKGKERLAKQGKWDTAAGFFQAAAEAAQPGQTALGSIARGLGSYAQAKSANADKLAELDTALEDQMFAVEQAKSELRVKRSEFAERRVDKETAKFNQMLALRTQLASAMSQNDAAMAVANARAQGTGGLGTDKLKALYELQANEAERNNDPQTARYWRGKLRDLSDTLNSADEIRSEAVRKMLNDDRDAIGAALATENPEGALRRIYAPYVGLISYEDFKDRIRGFSGVGGGASSAGGPGEVQFGSLNVGD